MDGCQRNRLKGIKRGILGEDSVVRFNAVKNRRIVTDQIHLVNGQNNVANAHHGDNAMVPAGLRQYALASINQQNRQLRRGGTGSHVACVLLVTGCVGNNVTPPVGCEKPVSDINGDALFTLGFQAIHQQREIDLLALGAITF